MPTAFYRHFDSIDELGLALVDESFVSLRALLREARNITTPVSSDRELFLAIVDTSVRVAGRARARATTDHFRFIARERVAGPPAVREAVAPPARADRARAGHRHRPHPGQREVVGRGPAGAGQPDRHRDGPATPSPWPRPAAAATPRPGSPRPRGASCRWCWSAPSTGTPAGEPQVGRGTSGRIVSSGIVASRGRSSTCRIDGATVSGWIQRPRSYDLALLVVHLLLHRAWRCGRVDGRHADAVLLPPRRAASRRTRGGRTSTRRTPTSRRWRVSPAAEFTHDEQCRGPPAAPGGSAWSAPSGPPGSRRAARALGQVEVGDRRRGRRLRRCARSESSSGGRLAAARARSSPAGSARSATTVARAGVRPAQLVRHAARCGPAAPARRRASCSARATAAPMPEPAPVMKWVASAVIG